MNTTRPLEKYEKICHWASKMNDKGQASALCFDPPRAISLKTSKYVFSPESAHEVTCAKCAKLLANKD